MGRSIKTVAICTVQIPFERGGAESHVENLCREFRKRGYEAEIITLPFKWYPPSEIPKQMLAWRLLDLTESNGVKVDLLIGCKFPAYYARHPNKVLWVFHQLRSAYDLWGTPFCDLMQFPEGPSIRRLVESSDRALLPEAKKIFANSRAVADRLRIYNGITAQPLYHPPPNFEQLHCGSWENYIFYPSRLNPTKRQDLLIEAMRYVETDVRCVLAGSGSMRPELEKRIADAGLESKVTLLPFIPEEEKIKLYANCLAVFFGPFLEDYGYVTLEAFYSRKPVITLEDSGGPLEFVSQEKNGLVTSPDPQQIARAIDRLVREPRWARELGEAGYRSLGKHDLSWDNVIKSLTDI